MGIQDSFIWYQKKIGTYDKQQWETTIEQRIVNGLINVPLRSTKPNTDLIDLDLVRGSSFTKAKPQHGLITVIKLATLRSIFLPLYWRWWVQQTSLKAFFLILFLYLSLCFNGLIYNHYLSSQKQQDISEAPYFELVIPFSMMWILALVHSQIVSTKAGQEKPKVPKYKHYRRRKSIARKKTSKVSFADAVVNCPGPKEDPKLSLSKSDESVPPSDSDNKYVPCEDDAKAPTKREGNRAKKAQGEDDGFESLNGNGSRTSEEDDGRKNDTSENRSNSGSRAFSSDTESDNNCDNGVKNLLKFQPPMRRRYIGSPMGTSRLPYRPRYSGGEGYDTEDDYRNYMGEVTSYAAEWIGITTNSEDCSYSSDIEDVTDTSHFKSSYDYDFSPTAILNPPSSRVTCMVWEQKEVKKADLSMLDITSAIISKVDSMPESMDYFYIGFTISTIVALLPTLCRLFNAAAEDESQIVIFDLEHFVEKLPFSVVALMENSLGSTLWERIFTVLTCFQRWAFACCFFFLLSVAERTFKQRFLYAKLFSHLTSSRRAQKSELPHFRLNKVRNIKTWLSVRSYLKKRGPQRSVDVIVSTAFIVMMLLLFFLCVELMKDTLSLHSQYNIEALIWCFGLGIFLLRFLTLGTKINKKYRNLSVLITEQINLHLQIEQKPHKKEELTVANNVLKLAIDLLKELESPFKIIGLSANPILSNITKVVLLSALSGVLSDMLGFKLKLHKIKIK